MKKQKIFLGYFAKNLSVIIGLVLIWRGVWYVLDAIDYWIFGGYHFWTGLLGIVIGWQCENLCMREMLLQQLRSTRAIVVLPMYR